MCDKELLLGYLYDELPASDRQKFDRHLASCADCREEVDGLRGTRTHLTSWAPPDPDLGFHIVRGATASAAPARWWQRSPAWGLAAAAAITLAVSAAIANVEVRAGSDGIVVRTGWNRATTPEHAPVVLSTGVSPAEMQRVEARVQELESRLTSRQAGAVVAASAGAARMTDAEIVRLVRQLVSEAEQRQQGVLARQILQVSRDAEIARRSDVDRLLTAYRQQQGTIYETSQRQKALEDHFVRVGLQR
jgi:hypothetical protein